MEILMWVSIANVKCLLYCSATTGGNTPPETSSHLPTGRGNLVGVLGRTSRREQHVRVRESEP